MNLPVFLLFVFCFGLLVGLSFITPSIIGQSTSCFVKNVPCACDETCICGNDSFPLSICENLYSADTN